MNGTQVIQEPGDKLLWNVPNDGLGYKTVN